MPHIIEELYTSFLLSQNIIRMIISITVRHAGHVALMKDYKNLLVADHWTE
jgi:hypothetical protein